MYLIFSILFVLYIFNEIKAVNIYEIALRLSTKFHIFTVSCTSKVIPVGRSPRDNMRLISVEIRINFQQNNMLYS